MSQDNRPDGGSLNAISPQPIQTEVIERTLSFKRETGEFIFDSSTQRTTGAFRIPLDNAPQKIVINAGAGIAFMSDSSGLDPLPFKTSGALTALVKSQTQVEIDVTTLPSTLGMLGFLLFVELTSVSPEVKGIQAPPFFVTRDQPYTRPELILHYTPNDGRFKLLERDGQGPEIGSPLPGIIKVERGLFVPRLSDGGDDNSTVSDIHVKLVSTDGIAFADHHPAVFTAASGATATRLSDTEIKITRSFHSGTGFGVSFGVKIPLGGGETCTVYSPDPVIIDKQIGTGGEGNTL